MGRKGKEGLVKADTTLMEQKAMIESDGVLTTGGGGSSGGSEKLVSRREVGVLSWDDYFMSVAFLSSMRSKDPSTQVGACIVNEQKRIVGIGYNGFPRGCGDDELPWSREAEDSLDTK